METATDSAGGANASGAGPSGCLLFADLFLPDFIAINVSGPAQDLRLLVVVDSSSITCYFTQFFEKILFFCCASCVCVCVCQKNSRPSSPLPKVSAEIRPYSKGHNELSLPESQHYANL